VSGLHQELPVRRLLVAVLTEKTMRTYRTFSWKDSNFRICSPHFDLITEEIVRQRALLEAYIERQPQFWTALTPIELLPDAPLIARRMGQAALVVGVGPMAAVAGTIAQLAAEAALRRDNGADAIVENGGDVYLASDCEVVVGLYAGRRHALAGRLAFAVSAEQMPLAVCSSSSRMGHSASFGDCDLATVTARDAALADAAATFACNLVRTPQHVDAALDRVGGIPGVMGVLLVKDDRVGLVGRLPALARSADPDADGSKVTRDRRSRET